MFDEQGIQHVSIEAIATAADTTKTGIYRQFASREELVELWLAATIKRYRDAFDAIQLTHADDPKAQLMAWTDYIVSGLPNISHRGCPFVNTIAEIPDRNHPLRQLIEQHKQDQAERIVALYKKAHSKDPEMDGAAIVFLLEGAQIAAQNGSVPLAGELLRRAVEAVLQPQQNT